MRDLEFIASVVTEWPDDRHTHVRLDEDGEICFNYGIRHDFFPTDLNSAKEAFIADGWPNIATGKPYTREQWLEARNARND